jgi:hypothetical protein
MTDEEIHHIYLHMSGKAEGLVEATGKADFPVMFARAILEYEGLRKDEPVAWGMETVKIEASAPLVMTPHPAFQKRTWVGLTDEEKAQFVVAYYPSNWDRKTAVSLMNDYEKYLKEKNNV